MKRLLSIALLATLVPAALFASAVSYGNTSSYKDGGVSLRLNIPMGSVLNPGEEVAFKYQTLEDAYVIVFNIDTEGYVHLIHPEGQPQLSSARRDYQVPEGRGTSLMVSGETGVEFVFALTVPDRSFIDDAELAYLRESDGRPLEERYRIDGDPFIAANIVAAELIRGISRRDGIFLDYTYFYINERVDYPCYLCGECDGDKSETDCDTYRIAANFDRDTPLGYPLRRAYEIVDNTAPTEYDVASEDDDGDRVVVDFYPYRSEVYGYSRPYVYRAWDSYYYDPWYCDPWYSGWYYYPNYGYGWGWGITVGWGWSYPRSYWGWGHYGGWGGYYCSPWYYSHNYHHYYDYGHRGSRHGRDSFKAKYKSGDRDNFKTKSNTLVSTRTRTSNRDGALRVSSKNLRASRERSTLAKRSTRARSDRTHVKARSSERRRQTTVIQNKRDRRARSSYQPRNRSTRDGTKSRGVNRSRPQTRRDAYKPSRGTKSGSRGSQGVKRGSTGKRKVSGKSRSSSSSRSGSKATSRKSRSSSKSSSSSSRSSSVKRSSKSSSKASSKSSGGSRRSSSGKKRR